MKNLKSVIYFLLFCSLMGCQDTRTRSSATSSSDNPALNSGYRGQTNYDGKSNSQGGQSGNESIPEDDPKANIVGINDENKECNWSIDGLNGFESTDSHLGQHNMCLSSSNSTHLYIQVRDAITESQVCFVPTHNVGSVSVYIGEPRCTMLSEAKRIYRIDLHKNRPGFTNLPIKGIMAMKDKSYFFPPPFYQYALAPDAYLFCSQFIDQYGDASYCEAFKSTGHYTYKQF